MKIKSLLLTTMAVAAMVSCKKTPAHTPPDGGPVLMEISLDLGSQSATRSLGPETEGSAFLNASEVKITGYTGNPVTPTNSMVGIPLTLSFTPGTEEPDVYTKTQLFPSSVRWITVEGNNTLSPNVNIRQGNSGSTGTTALVKLTGGAAVGMINYPSSGDATATASVNVSVKPDMARVEITNNKALPTYPPEVPDEDANAVPKYTKIEISGIYINNTRLLEGNTDLNWTTNIIEEGTLIPGTSITNWNNVYKKTGIDNASENGTKYNLFDKPVTTATPSKWILVEASKAVEGIGTVFGTATDIKAVGYNIFRQPDAPLVLTSPQEQDKIDKIVKAAHPHVVFELKLTTATNTEPVTRYLNIGKFKNSGVGGTYVTQFTEGNVYKFDLSDVLPLITPENVTPDPDPEYVDIEMTVTVVKWIPITVTPEV